MIANPGLTKITNILSEAVFILFLLSSLRNTAHFQRFGCRADFFFLSERKAEALFFLLEVVVRTMSIYSILAYINNTLSFTLH